MHIAAEAALVGHILAGQQGQHGQQGQVGGGDGRLQALEAPIVLRAPGGGGRGTNVHQGNGLGAGGEVHPQEGHVQIRHGVEVGARMDRTAPLELPVEPVKRQQPVVQANAKLVGHAIGLEAGAVEQVAIGDRAAIGQTQLAAFRLRRPARLALKKHHAALGQLLLRAPHHRDYWLHYGRIRAPEGPATGAARLGAQRQ